MTITLLDIIKELLWILGVGIIGGLIGSWLAKLFL